MKGETDLPTLLKIMRPERNPGEYVFCQVESQVRAAVLQTLCTFREKEAVTVILPRQQADDESLPYSTVCAWITLTVHSSLEAVGLTAVVSNALANADISCNMVAAYYHDHLFIPIADVERGMEVLTALSGGQ